ncbi:hypothetical protein INR49_032886 [Caranx melampygus]|nr:hypothetical protein INR49_032886 [Caranx melampygus]
MQAKAAQPALARSRPYQGVRVRDPVKELLRRKRSLEPHSNKTTPPTADVLTHNNLSSYTPAIFGSDVAGGSSAAEPPAASGEGGLQCTGWRAPPSAAAAATTTAAAAIAGAGLQPWSSPDYSQQDALAQPLAYPATTLTADLYMPTLCPSYTMLTYTHTPLLTNFGFAPGSAALSGSPLVHMPLSMSLTTMIPQLETQGADHQPQILELPPQRSDHQLDTEAQAQSLDEDPDIEPESPNLLDKLLEDQKEDGEEEDKDSYSSSIFIPNV